MKTKYKYIEIIELNTVSKKIKVYSVRNIKSQCSIGIIKWIPSWRQYCFCPGQDTVYSVECLQDVVKFLKEIIKK